MPGKYAILLVSESSTIVDFVAASAHAVNITIHDNSFKNDIESMKPEPHRPSELLAVILEGGQEQGGQAGSEDSTGTFTWTNIISDVCVGVPTRPFTKLWAAVSPLCLRVNKNDSCARLLLGPLTVESDVQIILLEVTGQSCHSIFVVIGRGW